MREDRKFIPCMWKIGRATRSARKITHRLAIFLMCITHSVGASKYRVAKVVIDAGHGGVDPGALGRFSKEKDIALAVALKLGKLIETHMPGVRSIYTRQSDEFVPLHERAKISNQNNADVFISIHCNAAVAKRQLARGAEVYTMGLNTSAHNLEVAKRENAAIGMETYTDQKQYAGVLPDSPESFILLSLQQNSSNTRSIQLAQHIQDQFEKRLKRRNRGVKQAGLMVLWQTTAPSVLVEIGFITHLQEEQYLRSAAGQDHIASGIFRALRDYKKEIEAGS